MFQTAMIFRRFIWAVEKAIEQASKKSQFPVCLLVKTIKGYGVKATVEKLGGRSRFSSLKRGKDRRFRRRDIWRTASGRISRIGLGFAPGLEQKEAAKTAKAASSTSPAAPAVKKGQSPNRVG